MFGQKAVELIQELERSKDFLPPFNVCILSEKLGKTSNSIYSWQEDAVRQILEEMRALYEENQRDAYVELIN